VLYLYLASPVALIALLIFLHRYEHRMLDGEEGNPQGSSSQTSGPPTGPPRDRDDDDPR
jgi:hypothetical protein